MGFGLFSDKRERIVELLERKVALVFRAKDSQVLSFNVKYLKQRRLPVLNIMHALKEFVLAKDKSPSFVRRNYVL